MLVDVLSVQFEDPPLRPVRRAKVVRGHELQHGLRHAAHRHVFPERVHRLAVQEPSQRLHPLEMAAYHGHRGLIALRPQELLEIHREHLDAILLRWNHDVPGAFVDGDERPRFKVVVPAVRDQRLDRLTGTRELLHLVKDEQCVPLMKRHAVTARKFQEERVKMLQIMAEHVFDIIIDLAEIYQDIALIFALGKLLRDVALADTARAVDQQGAPPGVLLLPFKQPIVDFSLHLRHFP